MNRHDPYDRRSNESDRPNGSRDRDYGGWEQPDLRASASWPRESQRSGESGRFNQGDPSQGNQSGYSGRGEFDQELGRHRTMGYESERGYQPNRGYPGQFGPPQQGDAMGQSGFGYGSQSPSQGGYSQSGSSQSGQYSGGSGQGGYSHTGGQSGYGQSGHGPQSGQYGQQSYRGFQGAQGYQGQAGSSYGYGSPGGQSQDSGAQGGWEHGGGQHQYGGLGMYRGPSHGQYGIGGDYGQSGQAGQSGMAGQADFRGGRASARDWNDSSNRGYPGQPSHGVGGASWSPQEDWRRFTGHGGQADRGKAPRTYRRSDDRITEDICERIMQYPGVDASDVDVKVTQGEVRLTGSVEDRRVKNLIEEIADSVFGVKEVDNQVRVKRALAESGTKSNSGISSDTDNGAVAKSGSNSGSRGRTLTGAERNT